MRKLLPILILMFFFTLLCVTHADPKNDNVFYIQVANGQKTLYLTQADGTNQRVLASGKLIRTFLIRTHFLYYVDHQLFEYNSATQKAKLLTSFNSDEIYMTVLSNKPDAPDQALIMTDSYYNRKYYILEFSDGSIRNVPDSSFEGPSKASASFNSYSSSGDVLAIIRRVKSNFFNLLIQTKEKDKFHTIWVLPKNMTIIPEPPLWAPNSRMAAFYAKQNDNLEGFYSLYLFNLDTQKMLLVQDQVFSTMIFNYLKMGPFTPQWSQDNKCLIFQYQPYGLPTSSMILKYDVVNDKKAILTSSRGHNNYPAWSPSGKSILFFSNRDSGQDQVYTMDADGGNLRRLSLPEGYTEWGDWNRL